MKKHLIFFLVISIFIPHTLSAKTKLEIVRDKIKILKAEREEAALDRDYKKNLTFFTDDILILPGLESPIEGITKLEKRFYEDKKNGVQIHSIGSTTHEDWLCGENYYERGTWSMSVTSNDQSRPVAFLGSYFQIWEKQKNGSYKIKFNIWNLDHSP